AEGSVARVRAHDPQVRDAVPARLRERGRALLPHRGAFARRDRHARQGVLACRARDGTRPAPLGHGGPGRAGDRPWPDVPQRSGSLPAARFRGPAGARHAPDAGPPRGSGALQHLHRHAARGDAGERGDRAGSRAPPAAVSRRPAVPQRCVRVAFLAAGGGLRDARRTSPHRGRGGRRQSRVSRRALQALRGRPARNRPSPPGEGPLPFRAQFRSPCHRQGVARDRGCAVKPLEGRKIVCCVGSGGVGKTTTAAALALSAAMEGKRALVLTIDPARRLANSLGLKALGNAETRIDAAHFADAKLTARGEMWAMMLNLKRSWDELVRRNARSAEQAQAILDNKLYQTLSTAMAGSLEYIAMDKVLELYSSGRFDVVVLDTPPTSNALDFLHAPDRVLDVLDNNAMRIVLGPMLKAGRFGLRLLAAPSGLVLRTLARFTGSDFLRNLAALREALQLAQIKDENRLAERLCETLTEQAILADLDRREVERLRDTLRGVPLFTVPRLRKDVHDLAGLWQIGEYLGGE